MRAGLFVSAGRLAEIARHAIERIPEDTSTPKMSEDAIVAILFSAFALEAFANEIGEIAFLHARNPGRKVLSRRNRIAFINRIAEDRNPPWVAALGSILQEAEEKHSPTELKFLLIKWVTSGATYNKGSQPYQDFDLLIDLRDVLVHTKPLDLIKGNTEGPESLFEHAKILRRLPQKLINYSDPDAEISWISRLSTKAAAQWAHGVAVAMVHSIVDELPECPFRNDLRFLYSDSFHRVTKEQFDGS